MRQKWIIDWLSEPRFGPYLAASKGDEALALRLHEWNSQLGASFLHDLGHLEIGLRNAYDRALNQAALTNTARWTQAETLEILFPSNQNAVNSSLKAQVRKAIRTTANRKEELLIEESVISQLTFGFWSSLTSAKHEKSIWVPYLHKAYPAGTNRNLVEQRLFTLNIFRNRVAHHEKIIQQPEFNRRLIFHVARLVLPAEAFNYFKTNSKTQDLILAGP